jgi:hypothetical protein
VNIKNGFLFERHSELGTIEIANMWDGPRLYWEYLICFLPGLATLGLSGMLWPLRHKFVMVISRCLLGIASLYFLKVGAILHSWGMLWSVKPFVIVNPHA